MHSTTGTKSGSCQSSVGDLRAPSLENTLFKSQGKLGKWESNPDNLFFSDSSLCGFLCLPPTCHPPIVSEKGSLTDRIQEHTTQNHMRVDAVISFILGMALKKTSEKATGLQMVAVFLGGGGREGMMHR